MTYTIETTVEAIIDRLLLMEVAALVGQTPESQGATKHWYFFPQVYPYWTNKPSGLIPTEYANKHNLIITARLWLAHTSQTNAGATPLQTQVWSYIPAVIGYFQDHRQMDMTGQANINYLDAPGLTIENSAGLEVFFNPLVNAEFLCTDFQITIPLLIFNG